ncbi:MAG TPA: RNA polymerase sigma factor [Gemmataceae bacterium]|nr:RNA polymerase sigma factor [Gemmataceae bacterium]
MTIPSNQVNSILRYIRRLAAAECAVEMADRELLHRFVTRRDEAAYAVLVRRHGPMVLRLCLRVLQHEQDAEDAFQATFLVLSRKAASLLPVESLGGWLYSVAYRIAQKARINAARRRKYEACVATPHFADPLGQITVREAYEVLDRELARLPDKFRVPLVLCYLEGLTRDEAAQQLGLPASTLKSRLEQARERLRVRLASRGLALAGALVASIFSEGTASAALPAVLVNSAIETALQIAAGGLTATVVPAQVAALAEGAMKIMIVTKLKIAFAVLLALASFGTVVRLAQVNAAGPGLNAESAPQAVADGARQVVDDSGLRQQVLAGTWFVARVDGENNSLTLQMHQPVGWVAFQPLKGASPRQIAPPAPLPLNSREVRVAVLHPGIDLQLGVAENAEINIDGQAGKVTDLQRGMQVTFQLAPDRAAITRIDATTPGKAVVQEIDVEKRAITVLVGGQEWTARLAADATVAVADQQNAQLSDLSAGMTVGLRLGVEADKIVVTSIKASGE